MASNLRTCGSPAALAGAPSQRAAPNEVGGANFGAALGPKHWQAVASRWQATGKLDGAPASHLGGPLGPKLGPAQLGGALILFNLTLESRHNFWNSNENDHRNGGQEVGLPVSFGQILIFAKLRMGFAGPQIETRTGRVLARA